MKQSGRPFAKGQSGNPAGRPKGVPNKATIEIKSFARTLFNRPAFRQNLEKKWDNLTLDPAFRTLLTHYAFGKPATAISIDLSFDHAKYLASLTDPDTADAADEA